MLTKANLKAAIVEAQAERRTARRPRGRSIQVPYKILHSRGSRRRTGAADIRAEYSEGGAGQAAYKLLRNTYILAAIERLEAAKARRMEVTQDAVLREACENLTKPNI